MTCVSLLSRTAVLMSLWARIASTIAVVGAYRCALHPYGGPKTHKTQLQAASKRGILERHPQAKWNVARQLLVLPRARSRHRLPGLGYYRDSGQPPRASPSSASTTRGATMGMIEDRAAPEGSAYLEWPFPLPLPDFLLPRRMLCTPLADGLLPRVFLLPFLRRAAWPASRAGLAPPASGL